MPPPTPGTLSRDAPPQSGSPVRHAPPGPVVLIPVQTNSNLSSVVQPEVGGMMPPLYNAAPRLAVPTTPTPPHILPQGTCYTYHTGPCHFACNGQEHPPRNYNLSSKILVNSHTRNEYRPPEATPAPVQSRWIKPTLFYDGFWTEQKVKRWISGQFLGEASHASYSDRKSIRVNRTH